MVQAKRKIRMKKITLTGAANELENIIDSHLATLKPQERLDKISMFNRKISKISGSRGKPSRRAQIQECRLSARSRV
jgi:hypothetical protein